MTSSCRELRQKSQERGRELLGGALADKYLAGRKELAQLRSTVLLKPYPATLIGESGAQGPKEFIHGRGNVGLPGDEVLPGFPAVLGGGDAKWTAIESGLMIGGEHEACAQNGQLTVGRG